MDNCIPQRILDSFASSARIYDGFSPSDGNNCIITSDWELPDTDPKMLLLVRAIAKQYDIKKLIIAGDLIATDQSALNDWVNVWKEDHEVAFGSVLGMTIEILKWLLQDFDEISVLRGNHDDRVARKTGGEIHLGLFLDLVGIPYSQYTYQYLTTSRGMVKVIHPRQYSANSLGLAQKFYNVTATPAGEKCHIVIGHTHIMQSGVSPDGLRECHALGCLRDPLKTKYLQMNTSTLPHWSQGFLMIRDGFFHPISPQTSDIGFYLQSA